MGSWGLGIYDNDTAMDCVGNFEHLLKKEMSMEEIYDIMEYSWVVQHNESWMVLADKQIDYSHKLSDYTKARIMKVIDDELANVGRWKDPKGRTEVLIKFKQKVQNYV